MTSSWSETSETGTARIIEVYKAQRTGEHVPPDLTLVAKDEAPTLEGDDWQKTYRAVYETDAELVVAAIYTSLPGGTCSAILRKMLERQASLLAVPFGEAKVVDERSINGAYEQGRIEGLRQLASAAKKILTPESVESLIATLSEGREAQMKDYG